MTVTDMWKYIPDINTFIVAGKHGRERGHWKCCEVVDQNWSLHALRGVELTWLVRYLSRGYLKQENAWRQLLDGYERWWAPRPGGLWTLKEGIMPHPQLWPSVWGRWAGIGVRDKAKSMVRWLREEEGVCDFFFLAWVFIDAINWERVGRRVEW